MRWECETKTDSVSCYDCFSCRFGVILHSPPSMIDAVTGATPSQKRRLKPTHSWKALMFSVLIYVRWSRQREHPNKLKELALDDSETK